MSFEQYDHSVKVVFVGPSVVGKSALLQIAQNQGFPAEHYRTIGVDFGARVVEVEGKKIKLQIWDTAGEEAFRSITKSYYRDALLVCIMWDASRFSAEELSAWFNDVIKSGAPDNAQFIFVRTKIDLDEEKEITSEMVQEQKAQIREFAGQDAVFVETSAKTRKNVASFLTNIAERVYAVLKQQLAEENDDGVVPVAVRGRVFAPVVPGRFERMSHSRVVRETHLDQGGLEPMWLKLHLASVENNCRTARNIREKLNLTGEEPQLSEQDQNKFSPVLELLRELDSDERALKYKLCIFFTFESYSTRVVAERDQQVRQEILNMAFKMYNLIKNNQNAIFMPTQNDVYEAEKETLPVVRKILEKAYPSLRPSHTLIK